MQTRTSKSYWAITLLLIALLVALPIQIKADEEPPPQDWALIACAVAVVAVAVGAIYVISKKCAPKYYWLWDGETPTGTWVGTATDKQCQIEGWKKISGPYDKPGDAPPTCPNLTNRVNKAVSAPITISTQTSQDGANWTTVDVQHVDMEDYAYFPTNQIGTMLRLQYGP